MLASWWIYIYLKFFGSVVSQWAQTGDQRKKKGHKTRTYYTVVCSFKPILYMCYFAFIFRVEMPLLKSISGFNVSFSYLHRIQCPLATFKFFFSVDSLEEVDSRKKKLCRNLKECAQNSSFDNNKSSKCWPNKSKLHSKICVEFAYEPFKPIYLGVFFNYSTEE